ncbi:hypothetical protein BC830DRAFT_1089747 [Chytriomyces sp. MP71]|nr:hypothetical protein BC830DRAFT_1089747 [Chytriomyces sp. MP71]
MSACFANQIHQKTKPRMRQASANLQHILSVLREAAQTSTLRVGRHAAAVVTRGGDVLSVGVSHHRGSKRGSKPRSLKPGSNEVTTTVHAETHAIARFRRRSDARQRIANKENLDLVVLRVAADGSLACSDPCADCAGLLRDCLFIKRVYFTTLYSATDTCVQQGVKRPLLPQLQPRRKDIERSRQRWCRSGIRHRAAVLPSAAALGLA